MKEYEFTFKVTGFHTVKVKAENDTQAEELALAQICEADFGELENIDSSIYPT